MPLPGEKYARLTQHQPTGDGQSAGSWIACDESGWDGEQLIGRKHRFMVFASVAVDDAGAAALVDDLRRQARIQQAGELKFRLFKDRKDRWSLLRRMWEPGGALHERCAVYVVDKEYAAASKVIDLLLEEKAHAEGRNLYADGAARDMARTLALHGGRALQGTLFTELMSAFVALASQRAQGRQQQALAAFFAVVERAWAASTRRAVTDILAQVRTTQPYARTLHDDPHSAITELEMLIPAAAQTARRWGERIGRISLLVDEQNTFTDDALDTVRTYATSPIGMTWLTREPGVDIAAAVRGSSTNHPSIQLADLLAGAAASVTERHAGNPSPVAEDLWPAVVPFVDVHSLLPYDDPATRLRTMIQPS